jgi:hypothetical protein
MGALLIGLGSAVAGAIGGYYLAARAAQHVLAGYRDRAADQLGDFAELFDPASDTASEAREPPSEDSPIRPAHAATSAGHTPPWWETAARLGG